MANPTKPDLDYSYTSFAQAQGTNTFPGSQLDNDLANLKTSVDETIDFVTAVIREDGKLANAIVDKNALAEDVLLGVKAPRPWATASVYAVDDTVSSGNGLYICLVAHTAGTFATDLGAGFWTLLIEFTVPVSIADGAVTTAKIANLAVTTAKIADNAVTAAKIPNASITKAKLAADVGQVPIGGSMEYDGVFAPAGWLFKFGQAVSRTTYSALLDVLCPFTTATTTSGSLTLANIPVDLRNLGLEGAKIEGVGIPSNTTIASVTVNSIVMSATATASNASVQIRFFPHGNGDGALTFNVPDDRDRVRVARGNAGGTAAARITASGSGTSGVDTTRLSAAGGVDRHTLTSGQMPNHNHTATTTVADPGHTHDIDTKGAISFGSSGGLLEAFNALGVSSSPASRTTLSRTTGITATTTNTAAGGGEAHPNLPPFRVSNTIIYAGV